MAKTRPRRGSPLNYTPAFQLFKPSRDLVLKHIWIFGPLYGVFVLFSIHSWLWSPVPGEAHHWWNSGPTVTSPVGAGPFFIDYSFIGFSVFWFLLTAIFGTIAQIMSQAAQLEAAEDKTPTFDRLWQTTKELGWRLFGLYIVTGAAILVGFILFIIPGIFMVRRYYLAPYVMLDKKLGVMDSMKESARISQPFSAIWGMILVMILFGLISVVPFIGWFVSLALGFLYSVAAALRYVELKRSH